MNIDIIFAFTSGQPDPLILPFLSDNLACKQLILLTTADMKKKGNDNNIASVLENRGIAVDMIDIPSPVDWEGIQTELEKISIKYPNKTIAFNANGGTKPMVLAAFEYCFQESIPVFYIQGNDLNWLYKANNQTLNSEIIDKSLNINKYLHSHGYNITNTIPPISSAELVRLVKMWAERDLQKEIGTLNILAASAKNPKLKPTEQLNVNVDINYLLEELEDCGLVTLENGLKFISEEARFFANGGWYELYLMKLLEKINTQHFNGNGQVIAGVTLAPLSITAKHDKVKNEIDIIYILNNRLYVFECKTANLSSTKGADKNRVDSAVYKLATLLKNLGGLSAKGIIASYRKVEDFDKERSKILGIEIIEHNENESVLIQKIVNTIESNTSMI